MPALEYFHGWGAHHTSPDLLDRLRKCFGYGGQDRATGYLYSEGEQDWPAPLEVAGPVLLLAVRRQLGAPFTIVAFQGYLNGSGCDWHSDTPFGAQAILSLGATRSFGYRRTDRTGTQMLRVADGDLVFMPAGFQSQWQHCVPKENSVTGERCAIVFRTKAGDA